MHISVDSDAINCSWDAPPTPGRTIRQRNQLRLAWTDTAGLSVEGSTLVQRRLTFPGYLTRETGPLAWQMQIDSAYLIVESKTFRGEESTLATAKLNETELRARLSSVLAAFRDSRGSVVSSPLPKPSVDHGSPIGHGDTGVVAGGQVLNVAHREGEAAATTKACPWCGETILAVAKKCKHCGEFLSGERPSGSADPTLRVGSVRCDLCGTLQEVPIGPDFECRQCKTPRMSTGHPGSSVSSRQALSGVVPVPLTCERCGGTQFVPRRKTSTKFMLGPYSLVGRPHHVECVTCGRLYERPN